MVRVRHPRFVYIRAMPIRMYMHRAACAKLALPRLWACMHPRPTQELHPWTGGNPPAEAVQAREASLSPLHT
jgi:hypothetical protein